MDDRLENNLEVLLDWLKEWREKHGIEDTGTLSETELNHSGKVCTICLFE